MAEVASYEQAVGCSFNYTNGTIMNVTDLCSHRGTCVLVPNVSYYCACTYLGNGQSYYAGDYCDESFFTFYHNRPISMIVPILFMVANIILGIFTILDLVLEIKKPNCRWKDAMIPLKVAIVLFTWTRVISAAYFLFLICQAYATLPQEGIMLVFLYMGPWLALSVLVFLIVMWSNLTNKIKKLKADKKTSPGLLLFKRLALFLVLAASIVAMVFILVANILPGKKSQLEIAAYAVLLAEIFLVVSFGTIADIRAYPVIFDNDATVIQRKFYWEISNKLLAWAFIACCPIYFIVRGPRTWLIFRSVLSLFELLFALTAFMITRIEYDSLAQVKARLTSGDSDGNYHKLDTTEQQ